MQVILNSVKHFYNFVLSDPSSVSQDDINTITSMKDRVMFWISSYRKHCARHQLANMDSDIKKLLKPEHVSQLRASKPALAAVRILGTSSDNTHVTTQTEFVIVRDFLLTEIAIGNANRSGVLANMTINEFLQARLVDGQYVVSVADHTTSYSSLARLFSLQLFIVGLIFMLKNCIPA